MKTIFLIPARGGSKGIPGKNVKLLNGKPLLHYSIELARAFTDDANVCVSTDDEAIVKCAAAVNLQVPFLRPIELSTDNAPMDGVVSHAIHYFGNTGIAPDCIILLQPTSPFRQAFHVSEALATYSENIDMVVSVCNSKANPYYNLFEEDADGLLHICKGDGNNPARQLAPPVYIYNGSIYIINVRSFMHYKSFSSLMRVKKYVMDEKYSLDIDELSDWNYAESLIRKAGQ